jgi:hypothetical protein
MATAAVDNNPNNTAVWKMIFDAGRSVVFTFSGLKE